MYRVRIYKPGEGGSLVYLTRCLRDTWEEAECLREAIHATGWAARVEFWPAMAR